MARIFTLCLLLVALLAPAPALANTIAYPDVMGSTVWYRDIVESSSTNDPLPLYGQPAANTDELVFPTTSNFFAGSLDGGPSDQTDGRLSLTIETKDGYTFDSFSIAESGLTSLNAPFGGDAFTQVESFAVVKVLEIAGVPVNFPSFNVFLTIDPLDGQYQLSVIGDPSYTTGWTGTGGALLPEDTTKLSLTIDNLLFAATMGGGTRAFIDKKSFDIDVNTTGHPAPEPTTFLLAGMGVLSCAVVRLRARRSRR